MSVRVIVKESIRTESRWNKRFKWRVALVEAREWGQAALGGY